MEGQLMWKDEYNIGVDIIDREHRRQIGRASCRERV